MIFGDIARRVVGAEVHPYRNGRLTTASEYWVAGDELVVVVRSSGATQREAATTALAHALAHQHDRRLTVVVLEGEEVRHLHRLSAFRTSTRLFTYTMNGHTTELPPASDQEVRDHYATLKGRSTKQHSLRFEHQAWLAPIIDLIEGRFSGHRSDRTSSSVWSVAGGNLLNASSSRRALKVTVGLATKQAAFLGTAGSRDFQFISTPTVDEMRQMLAVVEFDGAILPKLSIHAEHAFQQALNSVQRDVFGLRWHREYPSARAQGWYGGIDFLGVDDGGDLHVVETKVGGDPSIVLQVVDYVNWVRAHEQEVRDRLGFGQLTGRVHADLVIGRSTDSTVLGDPYLAGQLEALREDLPLRLWVADDPRSGPTLLRRVLPGEVFQSGWARPVQRPRAVTRRA